MREATAGLLAGEAMVDHLVVADPMEVVEEQKEALVEAMLPSR